MRKERKKRIKSFNLSVNEEFKRRIEKIFPLISDDQIPGFSNIATWEIVRSNLDKTGFGVGFLLIQILPGK